jgi:hypothetical protein
VNELHDLLDRATDRVENPNLAARALVDARRCRTTHRGLLAAGLAAAVVVTATLVSQLGQPERDSAPPVTPSPSTDITQSPWDPRDVDDLSPAAADVAPRLPDDVSPPATAIPLVGNPIDAAVLAFRGDDAILLLSTDGTWRSTSPASGGTSGAVLSADGTRLAVGTATGADIWTLSTGRRVRVAHPQESTPGEYESWAWVDDSTLLYDDGRAGGWLVALPSGEATAVPYPNGSVTVDPDGAVVESADDGTPPRLVDWAGGQPRRVNMTRIGHLTSIQADADTVVGINGSSVVVATRSDLAPLHVLPLTNPQDNYGGGKLPVVGLLDDGTVLLQVPVFDAEFTWRLVAWDPQTGEVTRLTRGTGPVPASYAVRAMG